MIPLSGDIPDSKGAKCGKIDSNSIVRGTSTLKRGFAHMLKMELLWMSQMLNKLKLLKRQVQYL